MSNDVLLIGIDAGDFRVIDRLIGDGSMPNFESIIEKGLSEQLESSIPPWTPSAWTSLTTGKNPGKHGIFDFKTDGWSRLADAADIKSPRIWEYLDANGLESIVVNVPLTHPASDISRIIIPGYLGPKIEDTNGHPDGILEEIESEIGEYRIYKKEDLSEGDELCEEYIRLMRMRKDTIRYLCEQYNWDFAMVQFQRTDTVFHELPNPKHIEQVYEKLDKFVGEIIDELDPHTVIIASDHGMGKTGKWDFRINSWLHQNGYLKTTQDGLESGWENPGHTDGHPKILTKTFETLSDIGITPRRAESILAKVGLDNAARTIIPNSMLSSIVSVAGAEIDVEKSVSYCPSGPGLGIVCEDGICEGVRQELSRLQDPDGKKVFEWVKHKDELVSDPFVQNAPDLFAMPRDMEYYLSATPTKTVFEKSNYKYNHKLKGMLIIDGPTVAPNDQREIPSIMDITPTVLSMFGVPLDPEFDGKPINSAITEASSERREYTKEKIVAHNNVSEGVEDRLEELGYLN